MTLGQKQRKFTHMVALLILHAEQLGYHVTFGDAYRDPRANYGHPKSLHRQRLAVDLNLFKDGVYLINGEGHDKLHDYWDVIGGADRIADDLNHYSYAHGGMR